MLDSELSCRRDVLHSSIRKESIRSQIRQVRQDLLSEQKNTLLDTIINDGLQNNEQLNTLIYFANQDQSNAIIYLGNLLIDGMLTPEAVTSRIHPSKNDYWCWLIRVLYSCRYCEIAHIQYILNRIESKRTAPSQQFGYYKSMNSIYSTIQSLNFIEILLQEQEKDMINIIITKGNLILSLLNLTTHENKQIYTSSIKIINKIIGFDSYSAQTFMNEYLDKCPSMMNDSTISKKIQTQMKLKTFAKYIEKIFFKTDAKIRAVGYQILTNLCLNGIIFVDLSMTPLKSFQKQKQIVKIQISYYLLELVKNCSDEDLKILVQNTLSQVLKNIYLSDKHKQIKTNIHESLTILKTRIRKICLEGNGERLWKITERLCLDSLLNQQTMDQQ